MRVMSYFDGFNLYFGLRSKNWKKYYWLDLYALSANLLKPGQTLEKVHYVTSRSKTNGHNVVDMQRQNTYLEALAVNPSIQIQYGHYLEKIKTCRFCGATWSDYEEKMTDVNIAVQLLSDAQDNLFDVALVCSGDSDLVTPVRKLRELYPVKQVIVVFPPGRHSAELTKVATASFTIGEAKLRKSQMPNTVQRADGFNLQRPAHWK